MRKPDIAAVRPFPGRGIGHCSTRGNSSEKETIMYIGLGTILLIVLIVLLLRAFSGRSSI